MNEKQRTAHFVAIILSEIKNNYMKSAEQFQKIIENNVVVPELVHHYGYLHMFGYDRVISELSTKEPLLQG
ncbi:MAG: hypothetical protein LBL23_07640 [Coriobacteriales bacterium]|nr:hypothetical protein [Coriobacteriales bacterium]